MSPPLFDLKFWCILFFLLISLFFFQSQSISFLQKQFIHQDIERAERIAKETLAAAAEAETAATQLYHQQQPKLSIPEYQVYSQYEYDQKIHQFKNQITIYLLKLSALTNTKEQEELCTTMMTEFKQFDELIYYNPEYANPASELKAHLDFFISSHQIWTNYCHNPAQHIKSSQ